MKAIHNTILIILFISVASIASACHEGDFDSSGKGHHKFGKNIGILQFTENSTISVSTTTSCDFYTAFLDSEYDFIQQQVAYGHGPHLDALAMINGCEERVRTEFSKTLRVNYVELFGDQRNPHTLSNGIEKLIDSNSTLKLSCRRV
jgi:hypothetical protein|tara:strand:- start:1505 stop:1945 length:441 start_codon:yes stop_codon:yes gene_type:complete